jgi:hypothetical protein
MLPVRALSLIREYSKPITNPYWRYGTSLAALIKDSPPMRRIINEIQHSLDYRYDINFTNWGKKSYDIVERNFPGIYEYTGTDYIQKYGERLLELLSYESMNGKHLNFYYHARNFLVNTKKFRLIDYTVQKQYYLEWVLV